jgi:hypothetical protein
MSNEITTTQPQALTITESPGFRQLEISEIEHLAKVLCASGFFRDAATAQKAFAKILCGQEIGIPPFMAMAQIHEIQGRLEYSALLMAHLIQRSGWASYEIVEHTETACQIVFTVNGQKHRSIFTMEDAKKADLMKSGMFAKYPRNMLFARALTNGAKWYCPAVLGGIGYIEGEIVSEERPSKIEPKVSRATLKEWADAGNFAAIFEAAEHPDLTEKQREELRAKARQLQTTNLAGVTVEAPQEEDDENT